VPAPYNIHIYGASGTGTTTLGAALAKKLCVSHFDVDDFYWRPTDPPFVDKQAPAQCLADLYLAMSRSNGWVLSGSLCGWGDELIPRFSQAVFLYLEPSRRLHRLKCRERERYGDRILPNGDMHEIHTEFLAWARRYDTAGVEQRSKLLHQRWSQRLPCPLLQLDSSSPTYDLIDQVVRKFSLVNSE
jgi:adenylate kinase family enzyme